MDVFCCGELVFTVNLRPFTPGASARFDALRESFVSAEDPFGNRVMQDPTAIALMNSPSAHAPMPDGYRYSFSCDKCGSSFVQVRGVPVRVPREVA